MPRHFPQASLRSGAGWAASERGEGIHREPGRLPGDPDGRARPGRQRRRNSSTQCDGSKGGARGHGNGRLKIGAQPRGGRPCWGLRAAEALVGRECRLGGSSFGRPEISPGRLNPGLALAGWPLARAGSRALDQTCWRRGVQGRGREVSIRWGRSRPPPRSTLPWLWMLPQRWAVSAAQGSPARAGSLAELLEGPVAQPRPCSMPLVGRTGPSCERGLRAGARRHWSRPARGRNDPPWGGRHPAAAWGLPQRVMATALNRHQTRPLTSKHVSWWAPPFPGDSS